MAEVAGSLERLALVYADLLKRVTNLLSDESVLDTFEQFGVRFPDQFLTNPTITPARRTICTLGVGLEQPIKAVNDAIAGNTTSLAAASVALVTQCGRVTAAFPELGSAITAAGPTLPGITQAQIDALVAGFPGKLTALLLADLLEPSTPVGTVFQVLGVLEQTFDPGDPANPSRPPYEAVAVHLDRLLPAISNPVGHLRTLYGWGDGAPLDATRIFTAIEAAIGGLGLPVLLTPATTTEPPRLQIGGLDLEPTGDGAGLRLDIVLPGAAQTTFAFPLSPPTWSADVAVTGAIASGTGGEIRPPFDLSLTPPAPGGASGSVKADVHARPAQTFLLLGQAGGSRLEFAKLDIAVGLELTVDDATGTATGVPVASGELTGGRLVIDVSGSDGFIGTLLGGGRLESEFGVGFVFTPDAGLRFHGGAALEVQVPVHLTAGPVELQSIYLLISVDDGKVPIELSAGFSAQLGPIKAAVERLGLTVTLGIPGEGGNLGPVDLAFGFKPPNGVGLAVDAGVVSGGGFLYADPDRGEYAGWLELEFAGFLEVKAIGLITTRMPDGSPGFSLLIMMTAEFGGGGIQLGYGFTLLAVGGLLGLNRRMNLQALTEGVRSGSVESVMFPRDVVANAPRIMSDLRAFFPPADGTFLIGPMAKIGWGTPTLVSVSLGVIIEVPGDLAIIGVLKAALPAQDLPLLILQVNFIGAVEFGKQRLWFFAQLFDSRVLTMTIDGGMGLLVGWGDDADLVLTVGGFHPSFLPPPMPFPVPARLSVDILNLPGRLIRVSGYFAITSNTVQFGARAELRLGFDDFGIEGHLAFDALFQFSPFQFIVAISAGVSLKAFGVGLFSIDLRFELEGPAPWRAHGRGSISLLFFEISADFDLKWGEDRNPTLPTVSVLQLLAAEITKLEGWETRLPAGGTKALVNLRTLTETDDLVLHPLGTLFIHQRALPLHVRLDRVGQQRPSDGKRLSVEPAEGSGLERVSITADKFAMAQFQDMDDAAKLSRPAYEVQDAGLELTAAEGLLDAPRVVRRSTRYELHIIDSGAGAGNRVRRLADRAVSAQAAKPTRRSRFYSVSPGVYGRLLPGNSTARSPLSQREALLRQPYDPADTIQVTGHRFVVAYVRTNRQAFPPGTTAATASFRSEAGAADALAGWLAAHPSLAGQLHVIRESEVVAPLATAENWSPAGDLPVAAAGAGAVVLRDGRVLVAGGADGGGHAVAAAAVFDPITGTWTALPALSAARRGHSVTGLDDGRVLVAGGLGADGSILASAELFDPVAGTWSATAPLPTPRHGHSATPLGTGKVLVAGGTEARGAGGQGTLQTAELYDPAAGTWTATGAMTDARSGHQAVLLDDNRVLLAGGVLATGGEGGREVPLAFCELYDPAAGTWRPTGSLGTPRIGHQATALADGGVLVTGGDPTGLPAGGAVRAAALDTAERYDRVAGTWTPVRSMPGGFGRHRGVSLPSGRVLVLGGTGATPAAGGFRTATIYDPGADTWTGTGRLGTGRWDLIAVALADGRVLAAGGVAAAGAAAPGPDAAVVTATTEIFTP